MRYDQYKRDIARAERDFAGHRTSDRRARCFDFRDPKKGSNYAFSLSWTPGTLTLAGDLGELVVTHYHALWELEAGLSWAATSDYEYLLGKTSRRPSFDRDATADEIIRMANERAVETLKDIRAELNDWRRDKPDPYRWFDVYSWCTRKDLRRRPDAVDPEDVVDELDGWANGKPDVAAYIGFAKRRDFGRFSWEEFRDVVVAPDGWELWFQLHEEHGRGSKEDIFKASYRRQLKTELRSHLGDGGPEHAAEICNKLNISDYYGEYRWTYHDLAQITAVIWGAKRALGWLEGERVYAWHAPVRLEAAA